MRATRFESQPAPPPLRDTSSLAGVGLGLKLRPATDGGNLQGFLEVSEIVPGGAIHSCGKVKLGDVLKKVDGNELDSIQSAKEHLLGNPNTWVELTFFREEALFGIDAIFLPEMRVGKDFTVTVMRGPASSSRRERQPPTDTDYVVLTPDNVRPYVAEPEGAHTELLPSHTTPEERLMMELYEERSAHNEHIVALRALEESHQVLQDDCGLLLQGLEDARADLQEAVQMRSAFEKETLGNLSTLVNECEPYGIPVMAVTAVGKEMEKRTSRYLGLSCRIAAELGARVVKTYWCEKDFDKVIAGIMERRKEKNP